MTIDWTKLESAAEAAALADIEAFVDQEFGPTVSPAALALAKDAIALAKEPNVGTALTMIPDVLKGISALDTVKTTLEQPPDNQQPTSGDSQPSSTAPEPQP